MRCLSSHDYDYDAAHRRYQSDTRENDDYWSYGYNDRNEVTGGAKHHSRRRHSSTKA